MTILLLRLDTVIQMRDFIEGRLCLGHRNGTVAGFTSWELPEDCDRFAVIQMRDFVVDRLCFDHRNGTVAGHSRRET